MSDTYDLLADAKLAADNYVAALKAGESVSQKAFQSLDPAFQKALVLHQKQTLSSLDGWHNSGSWLRGFIQETSAGGWQRNEDIRIDTALSNTTLYACVTLIAGDIAKLPPLLVEKDKDGIWSEVDYESPFAPVLRKPNHYQSRIDFYEWWSMSKLVHGNTYALKARNGRRMVSGMYILDPTRVVPLLAPDGSVFYQLYADNLSQIDEETVVPAREIIHDVMCPLFHPLVGVSPIYAAGYPAIDGLNTRNTSGKFFRNGSKPGGVLTSPLPIPQATADRVKTYWETNFSGDNIGKIAVLGDGLKYEAMAVTAEQSQLIEQLRMTDEDICKCFHMPRHKVGVGPDPKYDNVEALNKQYYSDCLQKHIEKLELSLDYGLEMTEVVGKTLGVYFDRDELFQMDTEALMSAAEKATKSGVSPNEVRKRYHDLGPVAGGETPFLQEQNWPIRLLADRQLPSERPPTQPAPIPSENEKSLESVTHYKDGSIAIDSVREGFESIEDAVFA